MTQLWSLLLCAPLCSLWFEIPLTSELHSHRWVPLPPSFVGQVRDDSFLKLLLKLADEDAKRWNREVIQRG